MIAALLLAAAPFENAFESMVVEARDAAWRCEQNIIRDAWMGPERSPEEATADVRKACAPAWDEYEKAKLAYHAKHPRSIRRLVPGFRPELDVCWRALESELNRWDAMPENIAARECKNARN